MTEHIEQISDSFWNLRGSFKIGPLDIGTHSSLVRQKNGRFVLLDAYTLKGKMLKQVLDLTDEGKAIDALINLHPFHTVHVKNTHQMFPNATLYGTERHKKLAPALPWQELNTDDSDFHALYSDDFQFFVPKGVSFISQNEKVHFSSVIALHSVSKTLHVDDTLTFSKVPIIGGFKFHMTLKQALHRRAGAAAEFRQWANELADACVDVENLCAAHVRNYSAPTSNEDSIAHRIRTALAEVEKTLIAHEALYGAV